MATGIFIVSVSEFCYKKSGWEKEKDKNEMTKPFSFWVCVCNFGDHPWKQLVMRISI